MFAHLRVEELSISESHVERAVGAPADQIARTTPKRGPSIDDGLMGIGPLLGPADVIMQLARPGVGYGVMESRVESGRVDRHQIKRAHHVHLPGSGRPWQRRAEGGLPSRGEQGPYPGVG